MKSFDSIDHIIKKWAETNNLTLITKDRDWDVRSFHIDNDVKRGRNYQIWLDEPDFNGNITVHVLNRHPPKNKVELKATKATLLTCLDRALLISLGIADESST